MTIPDFWLGHHQSQQVKAQEILDRIKPTIIGIDIGTIDASCEAVFEQQPDGSLKLIEMHTYYRTIDG
ncbi:hypothetical protein FHT78_005448 [Rhizobium sp. BK196]|uniref:hypothetical protein n=1 Tax=Rhizobium sp. BK196 TaxID=2587073 RepID=UPI001614C959|nr:hypothetical protein [Rhizobium sp. BK196]MBB3313654.1 hypothetical protein [Rhizobium sp. BK196]